MCCRGEEHCIDPFDLFVPRKGPLGLFERKEEPPSFALAAVDDDNWIRLNVDTGAAVTVIPAKMVPEAKGNGRYYRTASGERIEDKGSVVLHGGDELGQQRRVRGRVADVHKVLVAAGAVAVDGRNNMYLTDQGGYMIPRDSKVGQEVDRALHRAIRQYGNDGLSPLYLENGVYNFYLRKPQYEMLSPLDAPQPSPNGVRQVRHLP